MHLQKLMTEMIVM